MTRKEMERCSVQICKTSVLHKNLALKGIRVKNKLYKEINR
jgi:hypothetical protein